VSSEGQSGQQRRVRVLFVAGLTAPNDGSAGGQYVECSRLYHSRIQEVVEWFPLSSTQRTNPAPPVLLRAFPAAWRLLRFAVTIPRVDAALIYPANGPSLFEKGVMAMMARGLGKGVLLRFGSGRLPGEVERSRFVRRWLRRVLKSAHVVCSQGAKWTQFFSQFPEAAGKVVEIPNGIEMPAERLRSHEPPGRPTVAFVGWVTRDKGIFEALEIIRQVRKEHPNARLVIAGGGADFEEVQRRSAEPELAGAVEMLGWVQASGVAALLNEADVLLLPSHFEGMPNAVLEAMAAAVPVVCTAVGSLSDLIRSGENGYLAQVGDAGAMSAAVSHLLRDPALAARIGAAGRAAIEERFAMEKVWPQYVQAIAAAVANRPPGVETAPMRARGAGGTVD
jgi:glycosyltransferase involved in cell wall biosynthesis